MTQEFDYKKAFEEVMDKQINPPIIIKHIAGLDDLIANLLNKKGHIKRSDIIETLDKWSKGK